MSRPIQLKVMLSPEEYIAFKAVADDRGQSQSGLARQLIKQAICDFAESASEDGGKTMDEPVPHKANP